MEGFNISWREVNVSNAAELGPKPTIQDVGCRRSHVLRGIVQNLIRVLLYEVCESGYCSFGTLEL